MREIKFRAWDKVMGKMKYLNDPHDTFTFFGGIAEYYNLQNGSGGDEYELMQYAGLKDKNGREIYEGDIVQLSDTNPVLFKVEVILGRFGYKTIFKHVDDETIAGSYFLEKCAVIGNIYENPELLKG
jgi:uncharacterized phage protein (TIGR01671 family)